MIINREQLIKRLAEKSGFYQKDIKNVFQALDEVILECFDEVTDSEDIMVQLVTGIKIGCSVVPPRDRVDPRTYEPIVVGETVKPKTRFSEDFRRIIQERYNKKKG